jgi:hypothetical protein
VKNKAERKSRSKQEGSSPEASAKELTAWGYVALPCPTYLLVWKISVNFPGSPWFALLALGGRGLCLRAGFTLNLAITFINITPHNFNYTKHEYLHKSKALSIFQEGAFCLKMTIFIAG